MMWACFVRRLWSYMLSGGQRGSHLHRLCTEGHLRCKGGFISMDASECGVHTIKGQEY